MTYVPNTNERYYFDSNNILYGPQGRPLSLCLSDAGYFAVHIEQVDGRIIRSYHRVVALTFVPNTEDKPCVNHIDGDKQNNTISNLEWMTYAENTQHAYDTGLAEAAAGEDHANSKLLDIEVIELIRAIMEHNATNEQLAEVYNLHPRYVSLIRHKRRRKNIWDVHFPNVTAPKSKQKAKRTTVSSQYSDELRLQVIKDVYENGLTNKEAGQKYSIEVSNISRIRHGKLWKHNISEYLKSLETIPKGSTPEAIAGGNSKDPN